MVNRKLIEHAPVENKEKRRKEIQKEIQEFLEKGGEINFIDTGNVKFEPSYNGRLNKTKNKNKINK